MNHVLTQKELYAILLSEDDTKEDIKMQVSWRDTDGQIDKYGSYYYYSIEGERSGKKFKTMKEIKAYLKNKGYKSMRYFDHGEFKKIIVL